jgi:hypothetical protein
MGTPDVGTVAIHQLSNIEYDNTIRDLLGVTMPQPSAGFQPDGIALGFNTIADAQAMNPRSVKDYFEAAQKLVDSAFADPTMLANVVTCQSAGAGDVTCATQIITNFGLHAFRRPLEAWEITQYTKVYSDALTAGEDHNGAIKHVVHTMLSAPQFLYRMEFDPTPTSTEQRPLTSYEIASRLSYMLWSSMPDQSLFDLAASGSLLQLDTLQAQVDRMLQDPKSTTLVTDFAWQWFGALRMKDHDVDATIYPKWNEQLRASMEQEMAMYFDEFIHGGRAYTDILTADVNFVDAPLADLYGMPAPATPGMQRVEFTTDERRGVLGLAGFLTHTSRNNRTAPTIRGKWVLDSLLCQDIEPPANIVIPPLPPIDPTGATTVKDALDMHRNNAACSPCHNLVDPVGLGMEHYDGIGAYRPQYENGKPIDTAGELPGPVAFTDFPDMLQKLSETPGGITGSAAPKIVTCATQKLFTYGLGRAVGPSQSYLDQMTTNWFTQPTVNLSTLIKQLVVNDVFRFRHGTPDPAATP